MVERIVLTSPVDPEPARSPKKARAALWATLGVVAVVMVLVATANLTPQRPVELKVSERPARVVTQLLEPAAEGDSAESGSAISSPQATSEPASLPKVAAPAPHPAQAQGSRATADGKPASATSRVGAVAEPAPQSEPPIQQARVTVAAAQASVDDGQSLAAMLERCSEEKFLAGVICEQKVRLRYCEGKWGQVPQCTKKPHVD